LIIPMITVEVKQCIIENLHIWKHYQLLAVL
jgi:hypothetical protein